MVIAVSGAVIDNALRASPLAEIDQNRLVGRTGLFKRVVRRERTGARSMVKFVHNVRPPVPEIRLRGRFSIQIAPHGPGGAASDIGISEPLGEDGDRDAAWPLGPDPRTQGNDSRVPSARDACGSDAEALPQGSDRRFRHLNSCAPSGRRQILPK